MLMLAMGLFLLLVNTGLLIGNIMADNSVYAGINIIGIAAASFIVAIAMDRMLP